MDLIVAGAGLAITLVGALLGLAYQAGRHSVRIESLEDYRAEQKAQHKENIGRLDTIENEVRAIAQFLRLPQVE